MPLGRHVTVGPKGDTGPSGQSAGRIFYYAISDPSDIAGYKTMLPSPSAGAEQTIVTALSGTSDVLIAAFATDPGVPGAVDYPAGTAFRRIYAMVSTGTAVARFHLQVYIRNQAGTETLVRDEYSPNFGDQVATLQEWIVTASSAGTMLATDRIVNKLYASRISGSTNFNLTTYFEGSSHVSHIQTTISAGAQGPKGDKGDKGDPGIQGPPGDVSGLISDTAYALSWDGDMTHSASKNAVYDKIEALNSSISNFVSNLPFSGSWDGIPGVAPSKNAIYDKLIAMISDDPFSGSIWDGITDAAPSKNAVYDAIAALGLASGTYTPTATIIQNITSVSTVYSHDYIRIGSNVFVAGAISLTPNSTTLPIIVELTLPIASDLADPGTGDVFGSGSCDAKAISLAVYGNAATNRAKLSFISNVTSAVYLAYSFMYSVLPGGAVTPLPIGSISDAVYSAAWDGVIDTAPSQNAVFDALGGSSIAAGTYTPTITSVTNATTVTGTAAFYVRLANTVLVFGQCGVTSTGTAAAAQIDISLPIASNFTANTDCGGIAVGYAPTATILISANTTNKRAQLQWIRPTTAAMASISYFFGYRIM